MADRCQRALPTLLASCPCSYHYSGPHLSLPPVHSPPPVWIQAIWANATSSSDQNQTIYCWTPTMQLTQLTLGSGPAFSSWCTAFSIPCSLMNPWDTQTGVVSPSSWYLLPSFLSSPLKYMNISTTLPLKLTSARQSVGSNC